MFADGDEAWKITKENAASFFKRNHEEVDTRLILHACLEDANDIIDAKDPDIFTLMVYADCIKSLIVNGTRTTIMIRLLTVRR